MDGLVQKALQWLERALNRFRKADTTDDHGGGILLLVHAFRLMRMVEWILACTLLCPDDVL